MTNVTCNRSRQERAQLYATFAYSYEALQYMQKRQKEKNIAQLVMTADTDSLWFQQHFESDALQRWCRFLSIRSIGAFSEYENLILV